jgi:hypothetical protein
MTRFIDGQVIPVPFEHFRNDWARRAYGAYEGDDMSDDVLVFWLPVDSRSDRMLRRVGDIRQTIQGILGGPAAGSEADASASPTQQKCRRNSPNVKLATTVDEGVELNNLIQVVGPYSSDLLLAAIDECRRLTHDPERSKGIGAVHMYPWRATLELASLRDVPPEASDDDESDQPKDAPVPAPETSGVDKVAKMIRFWRNCAERPPSKKVTCDKLKLTFTPVIGTDWHLAHVVREELELRNAWPKLASNGMDGKPPTVDGHIVLITEKDTLYGNTIPFLYNSMLPLGLVPSTTASRSPLLVYRYLQGIDGTATLQRVEDAKKGKPRDPRAQEQTQGQDPQGNYQIDYLRRLTDEIAQRDRELRDRGGRGILAIGVLGSDVYDKLMVLEALHSRFPRAWFFTHGLDENFSRPSELDHTQNLLVASHFGLKLHPALQRDAPPFRDSSQTSAFLSTLMAIGDVRIAGLLDAKDKSGGHASAELWPWSEPFPMGKLGLDSSDAKAILSVAPSYATTKLQPLMYEIGRRGPYQLTETGPKPLPATYFPDEFKDFELQKWVQPTGSRESSRWEWQTVIAAIVFGLLFCLLLVINITIAREFATDALSWPWQIAAKSNRAGGWPRRLWIGVALNVFWIVAVIAAIATVVHLVRSNHFNPGGQPFTLLDGVSAWPGIVLRTTAVILTIIFTFVSMRSFVEKSGKDLEEELAPTTSSRQASKQATPPGDRARLADDDSTDRSDLYYVLVQFLKYPWRVLNSLWHGLPTSATTVDDLQQDYETFRSWPYLLGRAFIMAVLYFGTGYPLFLVTDSVPNSLVRGSFASAANIWSVRLAVFALCFISFLVLDVQRFAIQFIRQLGRIYSTTEGRPTVGRRVIRVIARHTHNINYLIWYPFIIMALMVIARQGLFTGSDYPLVLIIIQLLLLVALYYYTVRVRSVADEARDGVLRKLRNQAYALTGAAETKDSEQEAGTQSMTRIQAAISDIENEDEGAFGHWTQDYFLKALALPFLGSSGFLLLQRFAGGG